MATSLINDSGYALNISRRLIDAGLIVLTDRTYDLLRAASGDVNVAAIERQATVEEITGVGARAASDS